MASPNLSSSDPCFIDRERARSSLPSGKPAARTPGACFVHQVAKTKTPRLFRAHTQKQSASILNSKVMCQMSSLDTSQALEPTARAWLPCKRQFPLLLTMQRTYAFGANSCRVGPGFGYNPSTIFSYPTLFDSLPELSINAAGSIPRSCISD